jgi:hypothetical protein
MNRKGTPVYGIMSEVVPSYSTLYRLYLVLFRTFQHGTSWFRKLQGARFYELAQYSYSTASVQKFLSGKLSDLKKQQQNTK